VQVEGYRVQGIRCWMQGVSVVCRVQGVAWVEDLV